MDTLRQDIRFALRVLLKSPAFSLVAVLSLAVGIGANTAIYSVIDAALMRPLPVPDPHELVLFNWDAEATPPNSSHNGWIRPAPDGRRTSTSLPYPMFERFRDDTDVLSRTFAFAELYRINVTHRREAELTTGQLVSGGYFEGLHLRPAVGRLLVQEDDDLTADPALVLDHGYWQRRFGGDPGVLGQQVDINGAGFTIVGVTPTGFQGTLQVGSRPSVYVPMQQYARFSRVPGELENPRAWWIQVMGRLRPGVSKQEARAALQVVFTRAFLEEWGTSTSDEPLEVPDLRLTAGGMGLDEVRGEIASPLFVAWAVCGAVLLIACANLAGLLLARSGVRRREIAVRLSLGASRARLVRQLLTESTLLSGTGAVLGLILAVVGVDAIYGLFPVYPGENVALDLHLNGRILGFTAAVALLTGILFGLAPALRASSVELAPALKDLAGFPGLRGRSRTGRALVVAQVALSLSLLMVAGLFTRTLANLHRVDAGFNADGVLLFRVDPSLSGYEGERLAQLYRVLQDELVSLPGVRSATLSPYSLIAGGGSWTTLVPPGAPEDREVRVQVYRVASNFLKTMEVPLLMGRHLEDRDDADAPLVTVVNQRFARDFLATENPVGRTFDYGGGAQIEVVGMTRDAKNHSLRDEILPTLYLPYLQSSRPLRSMTFSVRTQGDPTALAGPVREVVRRIDPNIPIFEVKTLRRQMDESLRQERQFARLATVFGGIALALACVGLYGLLSHSVARRTREFGIRKALGAQRGDLTRLMMREMKLVGFGALIGLGLSLATTRWLASMLYGLDAMDPWSLAVATITLLSVATVAAYIPARRAAQVEPMTALRFE